jgi:parallel beta-helix repeat protein
MDKEYFRKGIVIGIMILFFGTGIFSMNIVKAPGTTIYVPNNYLTIQDAVDNANPGDTIIVRDGTYNGNVDIDKELTIKSENGPHSTFIYEYQGPAIKIYADNVYLKGFSVSTHASHGIGLWSANDCIIADNILHDTCYGICLGGYCDNNIIVNNICFDNAVGIEIGGLSDYNFIYNNVCEYNNGGIAICCPNTYNIISENSFSHNDYGIHMAGCTNNIVKLNDISDNTNWAMYMYGCFDNTIYLNNFEGNGQQIFSYNPEIVINDWNSPGEIMYDYNGEIYENYLGNYWGDFHSSDLDGDGIFDACYFVLGTNNLDSYPLSNPLDSDILPIYFKARNLAENVIGAPYLGDGATWGGKGLDCCSWPSQRMVAPNEVFNGYCYWDNRPSVKSCVSGGQGLDCSGLVFWSYNRAYFGTNLFTNSDFQDAPVQPDYSADRLYRAHTHHITKDELMTGDLLFYNPTNNPSHRMTHVMMFVGCRETLSGEYYNVIHASYSPGEIVPAVYDFKTEKVTNLVGTLSIKTTAYGRLDDFILDFQIAGSCPIDLIITDPDGLVLDKDIWEVPGMYYSEYDINQDGELDDIVDIPQRKTGEYIIEVIPEIDASPTDTFTLEILIVGTNIILAENMQIGDIPSEPYIVKTTETDIIPVIPANIDIDPNTLNKNSSGKWITNYIELPEGYNVEDITISTILLNDVVPAEGHPTDIGDYDNDGIPDIMVKFDRQAVQDILEPGDSVAMVVTGELTDETCFEGTDYIKVI